MSGFLEGYNGNGARGFLEGPAPTASDGIGGAINIPGLDDILASEGAQRIKPVMQAILTQESGGNPNAATSVDGARGIGQVIPATFNRFAKPGERIDNPADNLRVAARYLNFLHDKAGGDPAKMAAGYFSGEGNIGTDRPFKADHADGNGKRVSSYVSDVVARLGGTAPEKAEQPAAKAPATPTPPATWAELAKRPEFKEFTPAERDLARAEYFNAYIAPTLDANERRAAKAMFMEETKALDPKDPTLMDRVSDGLSAVGDAIRNLPDPLREKVEADKRAKEGAAGILAESKSAIRFDDLPVTPEYLKAMQANWNAATPAQRANLATRKDHMGVVARRMNEAYANTKSVPALDAIDPRAEARSRRLIESGVRGDLADGLARESARRDMMPGADLGTARVEETKFDFEARRKYNEDPFFKNPVVRGAVKGFEGYKQGSLGLAQFAADALGADQFAADMAEGAAESRGFTDAMGTPTDHLQRNFEGAITSIATQLPALVGGAATGSSALTLSSMFAQTFGKEYGDGRAAGLESTEATQRAGLFAAFEVIGERYGLGQQLDLIRNAARGVETNVLAKFMANTLKKEIPGEALTTTGQFITDKFGPGALNTEAGFADYLSQMADTVTQTIMQGGIMSAGTNGLNAAARAAKNLEPAQWRAEREIAAEINRRADSVEFGGIDSFVREQLDPNRNDVNPADTRKTPLQVWRRRPTAPDAYTAGLSPEGQEADQAARDAFADLTEGDFLEDEIPASTLLGAEADASSEPAEPVSMPVPEGPALEGEGTAAPAAEGKKTKLTPFEHPDLGDVEIRGELAYMADQAGWAQVGGKMIRKEAGDQSSDVTGRTPWIPKQPWYQMMPERLNEEQTIEAVGKALTGQPMTAKEKRVIGNMLDFAKASLEEQRKWQGDTLEAVGATSLEQFEEATQHADAVEAMDADIPFDLNDPRLTAGNNLTDEEIDGIFGKQQSGRVSEKPDTGNADGGAQGTGAPSGAEPEAFQLESETPEQVRAREEEAEKRAAADRKAKADATKKAKAEEEAKEKRRAIERSVDNFQLGETAERAVSGQPDIFDSPAAPKERFGDRNNAGVKEINDQIDRETASWGFAPGHFDKHTFSSGRLAPVFEVRDDVALPTVNNRLGDTIKLGQGPNGKWGFGLDIYGDAYGPGLKGLHEHLYPDGRTQYDTREEAIDAALQKIKAHGKPGAYDALKAKAQEPRKPKTEKEAKAKRKAKEKPKPAQPDDLGAMFDELVAERREPKTEAKADDLDAMFDELIAERRGETKPKTEKQAQAKREGGKWEDSPFADRIRAMLDQLKAAGQADMAVGIESGVTSDARHGQLDEAKVAFREELARKTIAAAANAGKPIPHEPITADKLAAIDTAIGALPREIIDAAVAKWNSISPLLSERGFRFGDVNTSHPHDVQAIHEQLQRIAQALMGLSPRRYIVAADEKRGEPKTDAERKRRASSITHWNRAEDHASELLGIDTRAIPGLTTTERVTIGNGIREKMPAKPRKQAKARSTGQAAVSAAKNTADGFANALDGLAALFGADSGTLGSGPVFNEQTYRKAIPLFKAAVENFHDAAADIREVMAAVIDALTARIGLDGVVKMKPYVLRYMQDYREGKFNEPATGTDSQQDRQDDPAQVPGRDDSVHGRPNGAGAAGKEHGGQADGQQDAGTAADLVVHDSRAPAGGTGRSDGVSEPGGEFDTAGRDPQSDDATGSGVAGQGGTTATDPGADGEVSTADGESDVKAFQSFEEKLEAQKKAEKIPVVMGDRANIDATLPLLLDGQREDVLFAETRLSKPDGFGVLFTNGTGTGKTYLSLGIIKRLIKSGKKNGIVVVPNQEVMNEWLASAPNLGIELHVLTDKKDKGRGVSITTYANFGDNMTLLDRDHDWAVADEAQMLMANKDAKVTLALEVMRAITKHPESAYDRARMLHRDLYEKIQILREQERKLLDAREKGTAPLGSAEMLTKIGDELRPLNKDFDKAVADQRALLAETKPEDRPRLVAVSATPFAWEKNVQWAEGYLFQYPKVRRTGAYNEPNPYQQYMMTNFGWHMKNGRLNEPDAKVNRALMQIEWNRRMRQSGALSTRLLDVDYDYDRKFILVDGGIGARIDAALEWLRKEKDGIYTRYYSHAFDQFDYVTQRRLLEAIKAKAAIEFIKENHALGRKVVVFHDYNQGGGFAPFSFPGDPKTVVEFKMGFGTNVRHVKYTHGEFLADFARAFPDLVGDDLAKLKSPIETLREAFPNALFNNGPEGKTKSLQAIKDFNNDEKPEANLLVVQSDKNAGWSGHDKTGKFMRVSLNLGLATAPVKNIQLEGRTYRVGQRSNSPMRYMNTGTNFERFAFATAIASRSETVENLAMGEFARTLKRSFIEAFNESDVYPAGEEDGKGGKERDRRSADMTPFDRAISYYFGKQKKNSRTKAQEGVDYFATPEPLGLKMVEWLEPKAGGDYLEPSAGHGAIARWFPQDANVKAIEPSDELRGYLAANMADPSGIINGQFEGHHIGNKYDGIAMNPPFGTAGKLAMEHVAKAFGHLKEGGRIVAIVPYGPAMNKRLEEWLTGTTTNARGVTSLNNPDARLEHVIELPITAFQRAGTSVQTRIIIIDRVKGGNDGTGRAKSTLHADIDTKHGDINDLFNWIKHMSVPGRAQVAAPAVPEAASEIAAELRAPGVTMHAHGRVVDDASKAVFKVVGDKLETDAPVVKITTQAGKELEGVYAPDRETALAVDKFTWKPKGQTGYFVRIRHVVRPKGDMTMLSKGPNDAANGAAAQTGSGGAVSKADANKIIDRAVRAIGGRVPGITFEVVDNFHALPDFVQAEALDPKTGKLTTRIYGAYRNGVVYIVLDTHQSKEALQETVFHELYAHAGIAKLFGPEANTKLAELYKQLGDGEGITAIAQKYSIDLTSYWKSVLETDEKGNYKLTPEQMKRVMAEELLAHIAEKGPSFKQTVREFVGMIRAGLRRMGFDKLAARDDNDLAYILRQARRAVGKMNGELRSVRKDGEPTTYFRREESAAPVNLTPKVAPKTGLLDTPMRLAFQKTGALAVWRSAFRVLEKTGSAALDNQVGEIIKAGLVDRYGLSDAVIERHEQMRVKMIAGVRTAERFLDRFQGLTRAQSAVLYAAANNADHAAVADMIKELPEGAQTALHEIKSLVRDLGQDAVDLKMLDVDTFKANEFAYLHRSYEKYELDMTEGEKANRATRIKGDQFKQRGLADIVSSERLMKWMPEFWGTRVKNGAVTNGSVGQVFVRLERRDDPRPTASLEGIEGNKALGRLKEVVYWPQGEEIPAKFGDWHVEGEWTLRRTHGKNVVFRRDFTQEERRKMGEIEDIRYAMVKTLHLAIHDVEVGRYFEWLAEGHAKLPEEIGRNDKVIDDPRKAEAKLQAFGKDVWVKVPETKVRGTSVNVYGKLAGRYVPGPVWTDIRAVGDSAYFTSAVGKGYEKLLRMWKISKTALSPAVHVNNVAANIIMADWHDVGGKHILQAAMAWANQGRAGKTPLTWKASEGEDSLIDWSATNSKRLIEDFQDNGGELGTYALSEMQREQLGPILEELLEEARRANNLNGIVNAAGVISLLREGMIRQAAATLGHSKAGRMVAAVPGKMIDVYQLEDQIFRLAAFIKARESGLSDREAGRFARKSFLDYDIQAPWVVAAKRSGLLPFIAFSYRAIPMMYKTLRDKPWKAMKLALVLGAVNAASAAFLGLDDDDEKDERRWLPKEKSGNVLGVIPKMVRMPWNTEAGNPVFLDIRRFIPAGDITDTGMSHGVTPLPSFLIIGGPLALLAEWHSNKSSFTGKPITAETDTTAEAAAKWLDHVYKWAVPNVPLPSLGTLVPGEEPGQFQTYAWTGIVKASQRETGTFGRDQSVPMAIGSAFGVKLEGYSPAAGQRNAQNEANAKLKELREAEGKAKSQRAQGGLDAAEYRGKMRELREKAQDVKRELSERATK